MIKQTDAGLMFSKWKSEESLLLCCLALLGCELNAVGRIIEASSKFAVFRSLKGDMKFRLRLDLDDMAFWYATRRELPESTGIPPEEKDLSGVGVTFPLRLTAAQFAGPLEPQSVTK